MSENFQLLTSPMTSCVSVLEEIVPSSLTLLPPSLTLLPGLKNEAKR